jgi:HSP20 family protein
MRCRRRSIRYAIVGAGPRSVFDPWQGGALRILLAQPRWRPRADIWETHAEYQVTVDVAGVAPEDVDVTLYVDALVIEGVRRPPEVDPAALCHTVEMPHGPFRLEIPLTETVDSDAVESRYEHGLLHLHLPKRPEGA